MKTSFSQICVRPSAVAFVVCVLCAISGSSQVPVAGDIHRVDFRNFTYAPTCLNVEEPAKPETVKVINGSFNKKDRDGDDEVTFSVTDVVYGDLTGDGMDEAVVLTVCNTGGSGWFYDALIYTLRNGKPVLLARIVGGDRASGGIRAVRIEGGRLLVESLGSRQGQAIGAEFIDTTSYRLSGRKLVQIGRPARRSLRGESRAKRIQFERGHTSAAVTGTTSGADFYVLRARDHQELTVRITSPLNNARFEIITGDFTMAYRKTEWTGKLEYRDCHIVVVSDKGSAEYKLEVTVR